MNNTVLPPDEAKAIAKLQQLYLKTERKLINEITRKRSLKLVDYAEVAALERIQRILGEMQSESFKYVPLMVETIFQGVNKKDTAGYENARTLTTAQTATSQILVNNLLGQVMEAAAMAQKSAEKWLALGRLEGDEFREAALNAVAEQQAAGASWILAQKNMAVDLEAQGITAFVDRAGRKWSLTDYCNMAVRTTARQSFVAAKLTADDHDLWQIVRIGSTCPLCAVYEGRIYSKSGMDPDYPPLAAAFGKIDPKGANNLENTYLNIHPNCLHSLVKYTTVGKTDEQIQKDKDFSSFEKNPADHDPRTKRQREEYRKKEQNRQKLLNDTRQWNRYRAALGKDCPDYETFLKHKRLDGDLYKKLEKQYREVRREAKKALNEVNAEAVETLTNKPQFVSNINFNFKGKDEKYAESKDIILKLEQQYNTRLQSVSIGAENGAGDVDITGEKMRLNSNAPKAAIHEFAHTLANSDAEKYGLTNHGDFWKEIDSIRRKYRKDVRQDTTRWISSYANSHGKDEFLAEAFTQAKLKELGLPVPSEYGSDFTYSQQVLNTVNKYFGRD